MGGGGSGNDSQKRCGLTQVLIFVAAIASGTACSLCSKLMMELQSVGMTGRTEVFEKPLFQTFGMFVGMSFGIVMHWAVAYLRIPFPGYDHGHLPPFWKRCLAPGNGEKATVAGATHLTTTNSAAMGRYVMAQGTVPPSPSGSVIGVELSSSETRYLLPSSSKAAMAGKQYVVNKKASGSGSGYGGTETTTTAANGTSASPAPPRRALLLPPSPRTRPMPPPPPPPTPPPRILPTPSEPNMLPSPLSSYAVTTATTPLWMYFFLAIPSIFDLCATALCMMGLRYLDVSIYQMLRGSGIIFVALMKQNVLGDRLHNYQWVGVAWNVVSVVLVGSTAMFAARSAVSGSGNGGAEVYVDGGMDVGGNDGDEVAAATAAKQAVLGVSLLMAGAIVQALQFVFEEKVMSMDDMAVSPLLLIGMEGIWGTLICLTVVYPLAHVIPGSDHGSFESPYNTYVMIRNSGTIQVAFVIYFFAIFAYNLFAVLVTFMLSSVWHAILDNFRPLTVWAADLLIYYVISNGMHGETWTRWSYLQLVGMTVLLYGTAIYNAPNAGSIQLRGPFWASLGMDFTEEYLAVEAERRDAELDAKWEEAQRAFRSKRTSSSFMGERSPMVSIHTQMLRGLGSPKM